MEQTIIMQKKEKKALEQKKLAEEFQTISDPIPKI